ncbi:MAG: hypothetical protein PHV77_03080 [Candidatus Omnitrophica bacterium]|nr:hypothetical protein [Candidatus Omnitrophota bacterium]
MTFDNRIIDSIKGLTGPVAEQAGAKIYDISLKRVNGRSALTVLVDKQGGISLDECALINKRLSDIIENAGFFSGPYVIEVSSPGLDRLLKNRRDFNWAFGASVDIWLTGNINDRNFISGIVKNCRENDVEIEDRHGSCFMIPYDMINKAKRNIQACT